MAFLPQAHGCPKHCAVERRTDCRRHPQVLLYAHTTVADYKMADNNLGRHTGLSRSRDVLTDMNNVRHELRRRNPAGYTAPLRVEVNTGIDEDGKATVDHFYADLLPLYFKSSVVRETLEGLDGRPTRSQGIRVEGGKIPLKAVKIVVAYCFGSYNAHNWAADLDAEPRLAAFVYDIACAYKIATLEKLVGNSAFSEETSSLNCDTAVRLLNRAEGRNAGLYRIAFMFICYNVQRVAASDEWTDLSKSELRRLYMSKHLRCNEEARFQMAVRWLAAPGLKEDELSRKTVVFYRLANRLLYGVIPEDAEDIQMYSEGVDQMYAEQNQLAPFRSVDRLRKGKHTTFTAFRLGPEYMFKVKEAKSPEYHGYAPPRFIGQFRSLGYYWTLEVVWYHPGNIDGHKPGVGIFLRLIHGTDMAGQSKDGEVIGVLTDFMLRLHCSNDWDKCRKATKPLQFDFYNLPGNADAIGDRHFLGYSDAKELLKKKCDLHVSVEIRRVKELTKREQW